ncbi:MAG TPA: GDSL-type esterase/lipase family protein [Thermoanaerobaculia bacterium]|nr:GDSL-type esterase/lipase family protein [Thermoanaerobaculia bacterium]
MRRTLFWYLPLTAALTATAVMGFGFYSFLSGDTGTRIDVTTKPIEVAHPAAVWPVLLGDSLARGAGDESGLGIGGRFDRELRRRRIAANPTVNLAINGAKTNDLIQQLQSRNVLTLVAQANVVLVSIGGNDLFGSGNWRNGPPPDPSAVMGSVLGRIEQIIHTIRNANPRARIFFIGLYNPFVAQRNGRMLSVLVNQWNAQLQSRFGNDPDVVIVQTSDLFTHHDRLSFDRFHPGDEGYELIARRIADSF